MPKRALDFVVNLLPCSDVAEIPLLNGLAVDRGVEDFHLDEGEATIRLHEKGNKHRVIGLNPVAAQAIEEYIHRAQLTSGPLFRPRRAPGSEELAVHAMGVGAAYPLLDWLAVPARVRLTDVARGYRAPGFQRRFGGL